MEKGTDLSPLECLSGLAVGLGVFFLGVIVALAASAFYFNSSLSPKLTVLLIAVAAILCWKGLSRANRYLEK